MLSIIAIRLASNENGTGLVIRTEVTKTVVQENEMVVVRSTTNQRS